MEAINLKPEAESGHVRCPRCGFEFRPWLLMFVRDIAVMFRVKESTVNHWMSRAGLPFRLWRVGRLKVRRVAISTDLHRWMDAKLATPGDGSVTAGLYAWNQARGAKGAAQRTLNKARRAATNPSSQSTP